MSSKLIRTTVVGSYPFPGWLEFASRHLDQFGSADLAELQEDAVIACAGPVFTSKVPPRNGTEFEAVETTITARAPPRPFCSPSRIFRVNSGNDSPRYLTKPQKAGD